MRQALLLIDIQNDYFPAGKFPLVDADLALAQAQKLLTHFRARGQAVIHIQHINQSPGAMFFAEGTQGAEIHRTLKPAPGEARVVKHVPNSFCGTQLAQLLQGQQITELVVCGMMTHMCVDTTVRAAKDFGIPVTLLIDACATPNLQWAGEIIPAAQVSKMYAASLHGMFANVTTVEELLADASLVK